MHMYLDTDITSIPTPICEMFTIVKEEIIFPCFSNSTCGPFHNNFWTKWPENWRIEQCSCIFNQILLLPKDKCHQMDKLACVQLMEEVHEYQFYYWLWYLIIIHCIWNVPACCLDFFDIHCNYCGIFRNVQTELLWN